MHNITNNTNTTTQHPYTTIQQCKLCPNQSTHYKEVLRTDQYQAQWIEYQFYCNKCAVNIVGTRELQPHKGGEC